VNRDSLEGDFCAKSDILQGIKYAKTIELSTADCQPSQKGKSYLELRNSGKTKKAVTALVIFLSSRFPFAFRSCPKERTLQRTKEKADLTLRQNAAG